MPVASNQQGIVYRVILGNKHFNSVVLVMIALITFKILLIYLYYFDIKVDKIST